MFDKSNPTPGGYLGNRYQVVSPLGQGGMGAVHCARDRLSGQLVALKRVRLRPASSGTEVTVDELASTPQPAGALGGRSGTLMAIGASGDSSRAPGGDRGAKGRSATAGSTPGSDEQVAAMQLALAREFHMLASLRHPNIIRESAAQGGAASGHGRGRNPAVRGPTRAAGQPVG